MVRNRAFIALEGALSVCVVVICALIFAYLTGLRSKLLVDTTARQVEQSLHRCARAAASSDRNQAGRGVAGLVFRPPGGPYRSYTVLVDGQQQSQLQLQPSLFLVNTDGAIRDDRLFIREDGRPCRDIAGDPQSAPDPVVLTVASTRTRAVARISINPANGRITVR